MVNGTQDAPVPKQLVDIDLGGGLDESRPEESVDWRNAFTDVQNLVPLSGGYGQRAGLQVLSNADSDSVSLGVCHRLVPLRDSFGVVATNYQLYHWSDTLQKLVNKGRLPEFYVNHLKAGSASTPTTLSGVAGVGVTSNYIVIAYMGESNDTTSAVSWLQIDVMDLEGEVIVKSYRLEDTGLYSYAMVVVDSRYLHIYRSGTAEAPKMFVLDTNSLPAGPALATPTYTTLTGGGAGDNVTGVVAISGNSVALLRFATSLPTTNSYRLEKFNNSGTSVANAAIAGFIPSGLDTDGTNFYVVGRADSFVDPATQSLTGWWKPNYTAGALWAATASAGTSGNFRLNQATAGSQPATSAALNGLTGPDFDGTNDYQATETTAAAPAAASNFFSTTAGTVIMVLRLDSISSTAKGVLSAGTAGPVPNYIRWLSPYGLYWGDAAIDGSAFYWPVKTGQVLVLCWRWDNTTGYMKLNSADWRSTTHASGRPSAVANQLVLGGSGALACADMNVYELIISSAKQTERWCEDVMQYLRVKYAVDF